MACKQMLLFSCQTCRFLFRLCNLKKKKIWLMSKLKFKQEKRKGKRNRKGKENRNG